jgi:ethanolamine transporter EutH
MQVMVIVFIGAILARRNYINNEKQKVHFTFKNCVLKILILVIVAFQVELDLLHTVPFVLQYCICHVFRKVVGILAYTCLLHGIYSDILASLPILCASIRY